MIVQYVDKFLLIVYLAVVEWFYLTLTLILLSSFVYFSSSTLFVILYFTDQVKSLYDNITPIYCGA